MDSLYYPYDLIYSMLITYLTIVNAVFNIKSKALIIKCAEITQNTVFCLHCTTKIANY